MKKIKKYILFCFAFIIIYAFFIEPSFVWTKKYTIKSTLYHSNHSMTIVQFSDTHLRNQHDVNHLKIVVKKINKIKPDFVIFTGDLISDIRKFSYTKEVNKLLLSIHAKYKKIAIYGNHDHGGYFTDAYEKLLLDSHFIVLKNNLKTLYINEQKVSFIGIDDYMLGKKEINSTLSKIEKNSFSIALVHEPDVAKYILHYPVSLQLSGHSHGGQFPFPFSPTLFMPPFAKNYYKGKYVLKNNSLPANEFTTLIVNNGIGTSKIPFRFLTPPELTIIEIKTKSGAD